MTDHAIGTVIAGRYRLGDRIGTGATAGVFTAHDERLDRTVAVKVIDAAAARSTDPAATRRFVTEARAAARFVHPNAVAVYDAGSDDERLFLVMELVTGGSLAERLDRDGAMSSRATARLGAQIAGALGAAHAAGIVHRDVKPANILLDRDGNAKLADFGIARRFDELAESLTTGGMVMGTRRYVSPEQANGDRLGPATDVFSLGVTLFETVTTQRPPTVVERPLDHRLDARSIDPRIDPGLAAIIARATAMRVDERFASADEMAVALAAIGSRTFAVGDTGTTPMPANLRPTGPPLLVGDRLRAERRHRRRMMLAGGVGAALVLAAAGVVIALGDDDAGSTSGPTVATSLPVPDAATTAAPTTLTPTTAAPTTAAPTTPAPTTSLVATTQVPATTLPPTTLAPPVIDLTGQFDLDSLLVALQFAPELAGPRGQDLLDGLERVRDAPPGKRDERADDLRRDIDDWVDDGELDPTVARAALDQLDDISDGGGHSGPGRGRGGD